VTLHVLYAIIIGQVNDVRRGSIKLIEMEEYVFFHTPYGHVRGGAVEPFALKVYTLLERR
jgi:hypothetical protein